MDTKEKWHIGKSISVGHIVTILGLLVGLAVYANNIESHIENNTTKFISVDSQLERIDKRFDRLESKIDRIMVILIKRNK